MGFARYDRVPYNTSLEGSDEVNGTIIPWEYVLYADYSEPADFNEGAFTFNSNGVSVDNRVHMFLQRFDGSVKSGGQIMGGYVDESAYMGKASLE